jgi:hypothetical protein
MLCESDAPRIAELPLSLEPAGEAVVQVEEWTSDRRVLAVTAGRAKLVCGGLRPGGTYTVTSDGQRERRVAAGGSLAFELAAGGRVEIDVLP